MEIKSFDEIEKEESRKNPSIAEKLANYQCKKGFHTLTKRRFREGGYYKKACKNCHQLWYKSGSYWHKTY